MSSFDFSNDAFSVGFSVRTCPAPIIPVESLEPAQMESTEYDPEWWYKRLTPEQKAHVDSERERLNQRICRVILGRKY